MSLDDYYELRDEYLDRNSFLYIFEISGPRTFGREGQLHVRQDNIRDFDRFEAPSNKLAEAIRAAYERELKARRELNV